MRSVLSRTVDRVLHTTAASARPLDPEAAAFHRSVPVVDLVIGTALFRPEFLRRRRRGHVDLPRLIGGGVDLAGFTIATRHPDLRGTLSTPHFLSMGLPMGSIRRDMAVVEAFVDRIGVWAQASAGRLRLIGRGASLEEVGQDVGGTIGVIGVQGGHALEGDAGNIERLHAMGVRMLSLAHVMDNGLVGSNTGIRGGGLTGFGREVVRELERVGIAVDLAHMSSAGIRDTVPLLQRPFFLSHTGFVRLSGRGSRLPRRRFTAARRNVIDADARLVAEAGGVVGLTLSTMLLGGDDLDAVRRAVDAGLELCGPEHLAIGSDFDGGLRTVCDVAGLPAVTGHLLAAGLDRGTVAAFLGGNALRVLKGAAR